MMGYLEEKGIKAVCFDIDGTFYPLWKTQVRVARASILHLPFSLRYNRARQTVRTEDSLQDKEPLSREERAMRMARLMYGNEDPETIRLFLKKEERVFIRKYERYFRSIKPYGGVVEVLEELKARGIQMGALSDFPVGSKLKAMDIERYFSIILSSEDIGRYKPCITPFRLLSEGLGVKREEILYVGDSPRKDVEGARKSGLHTLLLSKDGEKHGADLVASSWSEIRDILF